MAKPKARRRSGKLKCTSKPRRRVTGYSRCRRNTAGARNTKAEREAKKCIRNGTKQKVTGHQRKVCINGSK
jgi:hypothetical protein